MPRPFRKANSMTLGRVGKTVSTVETWFAIKAATGAQRFSSMREGQDPKGASLTQRNLRNQGFETFMPSNRIEVRHHRVTGSSDAFDLRWIRVRQHRPA
jgi:hypothetical protein